MAAGGTTGSAPHGVAVCDFQNRLQHRFLDAARRLPFKVKFKTAVSLLFFSCEKLQVEGDAGALGQAPVPRELHDAAKALDRAHAGGIRGLLQIV